MTVRQPGRSARLVDVNNVPVNNDSHVGQRYSCSPASTGMTKMQGSPELASMATPLTLGDKLCFSTMAGEVVLTDFDGKRLWNYKLGGNAGHSAPVAAAGLLVVGCDDGRLYAFKEVSPPK
jgi:outer membrane protein assembly factor BamB